MYKLNHRITLSIFIFMAWNVLSNAQQLDTVHIHKRIKGIRYSECKKIWFCSASDSVFSFNKLTKQDEYISNDTPYYFKIFGFRNRLLLEGEKNKYGHLVGPVTHYFRNGSIKQTAFYCNNSGSFAADSMNICSENCPRAVGTWNYYDKKGRIWKTIEYQFQLVTEDQNYCWLTQVIRFDKRGNIREIGKELDYCIQR